MLLSMQRPVLQVNLPGQAERGERDKTTCEPSGHLLSVPSPKHTTFPLPACSTQHYKRLFLRTEQEYKEVGRKIRHAPIALEKYARPIYRAALSAEEGQPPDLRQIRCPPHSLRLSTHDRWSRRTGTQQRSQCPCRTGLSGTGPLFCW